MRPGNKQARTGTGAIARVVAGAAVALAVAVGAGSAGAVEPDEMLEDPALEERAREVSKDLRCVVCQNESIDESNADMARDMRLLVRDRLLEGDSNEEVKQYLVDRYGDYVLLRPPFKPTTYVLWFGPALILIGAVLAVVFSYRRKAAAPAAPPPLTDEEKAQLRTLLAERGEGAETTGKARADHTKPKARRGGRS